jgi:tetratricopeptide (TPR) repeat protein
LLERAAQLDPGNLAVERGLAVAAMVRSRPAEALRIIEQMSGILTPNDALMWFQVGRLYRQAGNIEGAIDAWSRTEATAQAWSCSSPDIQLVEWGRDLAGRGQYENAVKIYRTAIQIRPTEASRYRLLSDAVLAMEENPITGYFVAREHLQALTREYPDVPWGYVEVARLYEKSGQGFRARDWTRRAASVEKSLEWSALKDRFQRVRSCANLLRPQHFSQH